MVTKIQGAVSETRCALFIAHVFNGQRRGQGAQLSECVTKPVPRDIRIVSLPPVELTLHRDMNYTGWGWEDIPADGLYCSSLPPVLGLNGVKVTMALNDSNTARYGTYDTTRNSLHQEIYNDPSETLAAA